MDPHLGLLELAGPTLDVCGTGGDKLDLFNVSTTSMFVVAAAGAVSEPWGGEPLNDLNAQQSELERINTELGFLLPHVEHEEHGRISHEGRYRVWKEMLTLDYFGRAARYE